MAFQSKKSYWAGAVAAGAMLFALAPANAAELVFDFLLDGTSGQALPNESYGTVTVNDTGGILTFTVQLADDFYFFHDTHPAGESNHNAFTFNVDGAPITIDLPLQAGFTVAADSPPPGFEAPDFTDLTSFDYALRCDSLCAGGNPDGEIASLTFTVSRVGGLTVDDLGYITSAHYPGQNIYFAADVSYLADGAETAITGNVGAVLSGVPEPNTWALMIAGFGLIGFAMRRRLATKDKVAYA